MIRAARALATEGALPGTAATTVAATVSTNDTAAAVLSAALISAAALERHGQTAAAAPGVLLGDIALLDSVSAWEMVATSERCGAAFSWPSAVFP